MWMKQLKKKNEKNVVLLDNELLPNTSLSSLNITHFPSTFEIPAGGKPVLLSNPQSEEDIKSLVNSDNNDNDSLENSDNQSGSLDSNDTRVVSASKFMSMVNSNTVNSKKKEEFPNTLSNVETPKGFTPSMGKSLEKLKGGRRSRKVRRSRSRSRRAHKNTRKN